MCLMNLFLLPNLKDSYTKTHFRKEAKSVSFSKSKQIMTLKLPVTILREEKDYELLNQYLLHRKLK